MLVLRLGAVNATWDSHNGTVWQKHCKIQLKSLQTAVVIQPPVCILPWGDLSFKKNKKRGGGAHQKFLQEPLIDTNYMYSIFS